MQEIENIVSYIEKEMDFYSYLDFYENANVLKKMYNLLEHRTKVVYKWYVYSREISYNQKNRIWDFLNSDISLGNLMYYEKEKIKKSKKKKNKERK